MKILALVSGRADRTPMRPVINALRDRRIAVEDVDISARHPVEVVGNTSSAIEVFEPDWVLVLGDRWEIGLAAMAATWAQVSIAHIHGGEVTEGSFDNQIRNAVTQLADVHFVATAKAKQRVMNMGRGNIFHVGAPGLDNIKAFSAPGSRYKRFVVTWLPETAGDDEGLHALLAALEAYPDYEVIFTGVNNDPGADEVRSAIEEWTIKHGRGQIREDMTAQQYHALCYNAVVVLGNSSSGIIEMPALMVPSVDVGCRQRGRGAGPSIFRAYPAADAIKAAIEDSLVYDGPWDNPYGGRGASAIIAETMLQIGQREGPTVLQEEKRT